MMPKFAKNGEFWEICFILVQCQPYSIESIHIVLIIIICHMIPQEISFIVNTNICIHKLCTSTFTTMKKGWIHSNRQESEQLRTIYIKWLQHSCSFLVKLHCSSFTGIKGGWVTQLNEVLINYYGKILTIWVHYVLFSFILFES